MKWESRYIVVPILCGVYGFWVCWALNEFRIRDIFDDVQVAALLGAALASIPVAKLFGKEGAEGWAFSFAATVIATSIGASYAVVFSGEPRWALFGPIMVFTLFFQYPLAGLSWLIGGIVMHLMTRLVTRMFAHDTE